MEAGGTDILVLLALTHQDSTCFTGEKATKAQVPAGAPWLQ